MNRRRFLSIAAGFGAALALPRVAAASGAADLAQWRGTALGARATITLERGDAALFEAIRAEIDRLENVFSLYRPDSALSRLNREGALVAPPHELVDCLALAGRVHAASGGLFDPTVQPLWRAYAEALGTPEGLEALPIGWQHVHVSPDRIEMGAGMALTLNGIAQGYIADRIARLLRAQGYDRVMVDTGELHALGSAPDGGDWPVRFEGGGGIGLRDRALASSAPLGTLFGGRAGAGHILDPRTRQPAAARWSMVSVSSPRAAVADALSTACCLMESRAEMEAAAALFRDTRIELARG